MKTSSLSNSIVFLYFFALFTLKRLLISPCYIKVLAHARMGMIKDRNCKELTEAEELERIHRRTIQKCLNDPGDHAAVITNLEPDILECEVKWTIGSIITNKARGGDGIPAELVKILKNYAVKMLHSICQQIWKTQQRPQD